MAVGGSLLCSFFFLLVNLITDISPAEFATVRFIGTFLPSVPVICLEPVTVIKSVSIKNWILLFLHGCFASTGIVLQFYSFRDLPLADASVICIASPIIVLLLAWAMFREPLNRFHFMVTLIAVLGVIILCHPQFIFGVNTVFTRNKVLGLQCAIAGVLSEGVAYTLLRGLGKTHYAITLLVYSVTGCILSGVLTYFEDHPCLPSCGTERYVILGIGAIGFGGQMFITKAIQAEYAGPVAMAQTSDIMFAFLWQAILLQVMPSGLSILGGILITCSVTLLATRKWVLNLPKESAMRRLCLSCFRE
ncbi:solute carrier family 35 member G1-like [Oratosquilla oratoria]|uniref:solute carrier family 35 member G1-like n=1 Tax=Oratosquilla oratoria TaxID=337810 RepID=UPI003F75873D